MKEKMPEDYFSEFDMCLWGQTLVTNFASFSRGPTPPPLFSRFLFERMESGRKFFLGVGHGHIYLCLFFEQNTASIKKLQPPDLIT